VVAGLKEIAGVQDVQIRRARYAVIYYDPQQTDEEELLKRLTEILSSH